MSGPGSQLSSSSSGGGSKTALCSTASAKPTLASRPGNSEIKPADLTGSVFLISSEGKILNLPIPARSPHDPLNWPAKKRVVSFVVLMVFSTVPLVTVLGPSIMFEVLAREFGPNVSI